MLKNQSVKDALYRPCAFFFYCLLDASESQQALLSMLTLCSDHVVASASVWWPVAVGWHAPSEWAKCELLVLAALLNETLAAFRPPLMFPLLPFRICARRISTLCFLFFASAFYWERKIMGVANFPRRSTACSDCGVRPSRINKKRLRPSLSCRSLCPSCLSLFRIRYPLSHLIP